MVFELGDIVWKIFTISQQKLRARTQTIVKSILIGDMQHKFQSNKFTPLEIDFLCVRKSSFDDGEVAHFSVTNFRGILT